MKYPAYRRLQEYVHAGHAQQKAILLHEYQSYTAAGSRKRSEGRATVLELACGGGDFATLFSKEEYIGLDASADRAAAARGNNPDYRIEVCDVNSPRVEKYLVNSDFIFCHGLLHHINDRECYALLKNVRQFAPKPVTFVAVEPVLPRIFSNPLGYILARLDGGHFIRTPSHYRKFFEQCLLRTESISLLPRWPVSMEAYIVRYE